MSTSQDPIRAVPSTCRPSISNFRRRTSRTSSWRTRESGGPRTPPTLRGPSAAPTASDLAAHHGRLSGLLIDAPGNQLTHVGHLILDGRLVLGVLHPSRVGDERSVVSYRNAGLSVRRLTDAHRHGRGVAQDQVLRLATGRRRLAVLRGVFARGCQ